MLITQNIKISWLKECRGAPYSTQRNQMKKAFALPKNIFENSVMGYHSHYIYLWQNKDGFHEHINRKTIEKDLTYLKSSSIEIKKDEDSYKIFYKYNLRQGNPERVKYDPETSMDKPLEEQAFDLIPNEYGRVVHNGRFVCYDSGNWYYEMDIINIINTNSNKLSIFEEREPDKNYKQIAKLY